jgi:Fic family protein
MSEMHRVYLAKGVQATTAIEGNTLSEGEVRQLIDKKLTSMRSRAYLEQEVENILQLCGEAARGAPMDCQAPVTLVRLCHYDRVILQNVPVADGVIPGELRTHNVVVGPYRPPDHQDVEDLTEQLCNWLNGSSLALGEGLETASCIIKAIVAHLYVAWIHPFGDGNGRAARILEFSILLGSGIPTPACHLLSNHYNRTRTEYYRLLEQASRKRDITDFMGYAIQGFLDGLQEQLEYAYEHVIAVSWESYVYERFRSAQYHDRVMKRLRALVLELTRRKKPVSAEEFDELRAALGSYYAGRSDIMLTRDLDELTKMRLIERTDKGYVALWRKMLSYVPPKAATEPPAQAE